MSEPRFEPVMDTDETINLCLHCTRSTCTGMCTKILQTRVSSWHRGQELKDLHAQGLTDKEISEIIGLARSTIYYQRAKLGLKSNKK